MAKYNYEVVVPITGYAVVTVESDAPLSEDEAIELACNSEITMGNIEEWDTCEKVVEGNVCYAIQWCAEVVDEWEEN